MIKIESKFKPKRRIKLWGTHALALGVDKTCIMVRSRLLGIKIQLNFKER